MISKSKKYSCDNSTFKWETGPRRIFLGGVTFTFSCTHLQRQNKRNDSAERGTPKSTLTVHIFDTSVLDIQVAKLLKACIQI